MAYFAFSNHVADLVIRATKERCCILSANPTEIVDTFSSVVDPSCLVADINLIDDGLASAINTAQRISRTPVGICPYSDSHPDALVRLLRPSYGCAPTAAKYIAYSVDAEAFDSIQTLPGIAGVIKSFASGDTVDVCKELGAGGTCFVAQLNGRQTFCFLDAHACIHPDSFGNVRNTPGVITPETCPVEHFLIQSCHSPFRWHDLGTNYYSVPLAFILRGAAQTFVTSTRVQSLVPNLLDLYMSCANAGMTIGEIVLELNGHCRALRIDEDPFVMFGHPDSRVVMRAEVTRHSRSLETGAFDRYRSHLYALGSVLQNMRFSRDFILGVVPSTALVDRDARALVGNCVQHLQAIKSKGTEASLDEARFLNNATAAAKSLEKALNRISIEEKRFFEQFTLVSKAFSAQTLRFRSLQAVAATPSTHPDLEMFTAALLRTGQKDALAALSAELVEMWKQKQGYYYYFSDRLESLFLPDAPVQTNRPCPSCRSPLLSKPHRYIGLNPTRSYQSRQQLVCPRCLVVSDASPLCAAHIESTLKREEAECQVEITYRNSGANPELVFGYCHVNDPNNVSANLSVDLFSQLLGGITVTHSDWKPRTIGPGETWFCTVHVEHIPPDLFYLLFEVHLFIDGCWNWLSFTYRKACLDEWLQTPEYVRSLPQRKL